MRCAAAKGTVCIVIVITTDKNAYGKAVIHYDRYRYSLPNC
jgi:hypothetical protein